MSLGSGHGLLAAPYTLVLTKQGALFDREDARRRHRESLLAWLKDHARAFGDEF